MTSISPPRSLGRTRALPTRWWPGLTRALEEDDNPRLVVQPIADLQRGTVVGHEVLARFDGPPHAAPDEWFAAAAVAGLAARLEAKVLASALGLRAQLPANTFLTVNVDPNLLPTPELRATLAAAGPLERVVLELTEHTVIAEHDLVAAAVDDWRDAGARIAVDDTGAGYAGLRLLLTLRPDIVKLDRALVCGIDVDPARRSLVRMLGEFSAHVDAWLLAEGIEHSGELDELLALGVPLGQGYLVGRPEPLWTPQLAAPIIDRIVERRRAGEFTDHVAPLIESAPTSQGGTADGSEEYSVALDDLARPVGLSGAALRRQHRPTEVSLLLAKPSEPIAALAHRAMTRGVTTRFDPIVCCDGRGAYVGIVRIDRLVDALAREM